MPEPLPPTGRAIGIDLGLLRLATLSNGNEVENLRRDRQVLRDLRGVQRKIDRALGGSNRRKLVQNLQRLLLGVANTRKDFLNTLAAELIRRYDRIVLEDLRVAAMARGRFALSTLDAVWSFLVSRLAHKAESAGRAIVLVDPSGSSQTCSGCGVIWEHLGLSERWIACACGVSLDRDHNTAINILQRGRNRPLVAKLSAERVCPEAARLEPWRSVHHFSSSGACDNGRHPRRSCFMVKRAGGRAGDAGGSIQAVIPLRELSGLATGNGSWRTMPSREDQHYARSWRYGQRHPGGSL